MVYDNGTNDLATGLDAGTVEVGNQVTLGGTNRYLSRLAVEYWGTNSEQGQFEGPVSMRVRLYANNGPTNMAGWPAAPGTVLYDSGPVGITAQARGVVELKQFQVGTAVPLAKRLPESFTWTVQFEGMNSNDAAGVSLYGPPVAGEVADGYWIQTNGVWNWQEGGGYGFGGQMQATREGAVLALVGSGTNVDCGNGYTAWQSWQASDACGHVAVCTQSVQVVDQEVPLIESQPLTNQTVLQGQTVSLEVGVFSCSELGYQWYFEETNALVQGTNATLELSNVSPADSGSYQVVVTNLYGSVTSAPAQLLVVVPAAIESGPTDQVATNGDTVNWTVVAQGTEPLGYQWYFEGTNALAEGTNASLELSDVSPADSGSYQVVVTNLYGSVTSAPAQLLVVVPAAIESGPTDHVATNGDTVNWTVLAQGTEPLGYQWYFEGTNALAQGTNASLELSDVSPADSGVYQVVVTNLYGSVTSAPAQLLVVVPAAIESGPTDQVATNGDTVNWTVVAQGTEPLGYQWYFEGTNALVEGTNASLELSNVSLADSGVYQVVVTNLYGSVTSAPAQLMVVVPAAIVSGPTDQVATNGQTVNWTVVAQGTEPLGYQWYFEGTNALAQGTNASLELSDVSPADSGVYQVVVTNLYGSATSAPASLMVIVLPTLTCGSNEVVDLGSSWDFTEPTAGGSNMTISVESTVTNAGCGLGYSVTRTWKVSDEQGYEDSCSQTVEVVDTNTPVLTCGTDKTVAYGSQWSFEVPGARESGVEEMVYDNGTNDLATGLDAGTVEVGNQVTLGGTNRYLSRLAVEYWGTNSEQSEFEGPVSMRVRLYLDDGPGPTLGRPPMPGTIMYDSGPIGIKAEARGVVELRQFQVGAAVPLERPLPESFTWTVQFEGMSSNDAAGVSLYGPPVVGTAADGYWTQQDGKWSWQKGAGYSFGGQLEALPQGVTLVALGSGTNVDCGNGYTAWQSWQASDACGHVAVCTQSVQVVDQEVPLIESQPLTNQTVLQGQTVSLEVGVFSCSELGYQWYFEETNALVEGTNASLELSNVSPADSGSYQVVVTNLYGSVTSAPAQLLVVVPAAIVSGPTDQVATNGDNVNWTVVAQGTEPLGYQWYFEGTNALVQGTNASLELASVSPVDSGVYQVVVTNLYGSVTSAPATLVVYTLPAILTQPVDQIVPAGGVASFEISAAGIPAPSYQWLFNGTNNLAGQTGTTLTLNNVQSDLEGYYSVLVSNTVGSTLSAPALLTVNNSPVITVQPQSMSVLQGDTIFLSVTALGKEPLTYQWYVGGTIPISQATSSSFRLKNVTQTESGSYSVAVSNEVGFVISQPAVVRVLIKPELIAITRTQGVVNLTFSTVTNLVYSVDYKDDLDATQWIALPDAALLPGTGAPITVHDADPSPSWRFYRIIVQ